MVKRDNISKITLYKTELAHVDCSCYLELEEQKYETTINLTNLWRISRSGVKTISVKRSWFSDHTRAGYGYRFTFNITSEDTNTSVTFNASGHDPTKIRLLKKDAQKPLTFSYCMVYFKVLNNFFMLSPQTEPF